MEGKFRLLLSRVIFHSKDKMFAMNIHKLLWISNLESFVFYNQFVQMNITFLVQ